MSSDKPGPDPGQGVYAISVAAELLGIGSQTLRLYERRGLLEPTRSEGGTRRYSGNDLDRLRRIAMLIDAGVNLAGVAMVLDLQDVNARMRADLDDRYPSRRAKASRASPGTDTTAAPVPPTGKRDKGRAR